jgi:chitosanase
MNLTPQKKRICEHVVNVFETGSIEGDYSTVSIFSDGPHGIRQVTYGRSQTTEYGNLKELVRMYADGQGTVSEQLRAFVPKIGVAPWSTTSLQAPVEGRRQERPGDAAGPGRLLR